MYPKIRCDGESWKVFGFWWELNKAQILLFANSQNNIERKKDFISNSLVKLFPKTPKPTNQMKSPDKRTKSFAKCTKSPAKHEEKDRCQARSPHVYLYARQGDMPS